MSEKELQNFTRKELCVLPLQAKKDVRPTLLQLTGLLGIPHKKNTAFHF